MRTELTTKGRFHFFFCSLLLFSSSVLLVLPLASAQFTPGEDYVWNPPDNVDAKCVPWSGKPAQCASVVGIQEGDPIFIGANWTASSHQFWSSGIFNLGTSLQDLVPVDCAESVTVLFCLTWFRPCATVQDGDNTETLVLPIQPCADLCYHHLNVCTAAFAAVLNYDPGVAFFLPPNEQFPLLCNETDYDAHYTPYWQEERYNITHEGRSLEFNCSAPKEVFVPDECQEPFKATTVNGEFRCGLECPLPSLTDEEYDAIKALQLTFGWLSWVGSLVWIITSVIYQKFRKFPSNMLMMSAIAAHIAAGAMVLPSFGGHDLWWCGEDGQVVAIELKIDGKALPRSDFELEDLECSSGLCTFQGMILHFGYLCSTIWWACVSLNMFLKLYFRERLMPDSKEEKILQIVYHVVAWGVSLVFSIIPAAADRVAFPLGGTFCFISSKDNQAYLLTFWFIPVGIALCAGSTFFVASIVQIVRRAILSKKVKSVFLSNYSLLIFVSIFLFNYTFIFAYSIKFYQDEDEIMDQYLKYYTCLYYPDQDSSTAQEAIGCNFDSVTVNYELLGLRGFAYASLGFLLFLALFPRRMVIRAWQKRFKDVAKSVGTSSTQLSSLRQKEGGTDSSTTGAQKKSEN
ncbi:hypothetical protein QOT17_010291 [Balamuthia mandrillaris]